MLHHLTLGRNIGDSGYVSDLDWELYCQEVLDANFDGYTVQDAMGSWKSMPEDSKVVIIDTADTQLVHDVAQLYKEMYQQEAVGLYTTSNMEFIKLCKIIPMTQSSQSWLLTHLSRSNDYYIAMTKLCSYTIKIQRT